ncbi:MAG: signal peptidase II, partial [Nitrospinota bacterium]
MKKIYEYRVLFVLTIIVALDHVLKYAIHSTLMLGESITVIPGFFSIVYVKNYGIVFGIFNENNTWFVIGLA